MELSDEREILPLSSHALGGAKNAGVENAGLIMRRNPSEEIP